MVIVKNPRESESIDAIFYDCGKISSNAEWFETSKLIQKAAMLYF